jgi:hypothetical protein
MYRTGWGIQSIKLLINDDCDNDCKNMEYSIENKKQLVQKIIMQPVIFDMFVIHCNVPRYTPKK